MQMRQTAGEIAVRSVAVFNPAQTLSLPGGQEDFRMAKVIRKLHNCTNDDNRNTYQFSPV